MKRSRNYLWPLFLLYIVTSFIGGITTYAEETTTESGTEDPLGGFNYQVVFPDNQHTRDVGYFNLMMTPAQEQTVEIQLINDSPQEMTIDISLNGTKTNGNGVIEYGPTDIEDDKSLKYKFTDIVTGENKVVLPANSIVPYYLTIKMPEASYDGQIVGGVQLKQEVDHTDSQGGIINEYAYMVGMVLQENETVLEPDLTMNTVYAGLSNYRNAVFINFSNTVAEFLRDMTVDVQIMPADSEEVLYDTKKAGMDMAPNTLINFPVTMNGDRMEPGDYKAYVLVTAGEKRWEWTEPFTITDEEADKFNGQDVSLLQERTIDWKMIAAIVGGALVVILIIFVIVRTVLKKNGKKKGKRKPSKKGNRK
ncbi:DUF916 and DUF3324 domain-containing protein [Enterococcus sp. BWM-S5]|uniref:DUF916 and DUF3324 domain-containing protein n=1 Tax=Enterococcus larvae TaxID=2794352 RepID=A0ABS4CLQ2_9ENTE|nr:DUF916 and DUF3324 domain-containing protein [Enterococcus larvae]MBP1047511.1 DUF916 and DUF3324 domain-containing protein [Enterococcus larvae]